MLRHIGRAVVEPVCAVHIGVVGDLLAVPDSVADLIGIHHLPVVPGVHLLLLVGVAVGALVGGAGDGILGDGDDGEHLLVLVIHIAVGGVVAAVRQVLIVLVAHGAAGDEGGAVAGVGLDVVGGGGPDVNVVVAVQEQVHAQGVDGPLGVIDEVVDDLGGRMVGGVGAGVGQHDAPLLVGALIALLGPLELLGDDIRLLLRRRHLRVDDHDAGVAVLDAADGIVKLRAAVAAGHVEPLGKGHEAPVALHLVVAGDGDGGDGGVVVAHDLEAGLPLGGLVAVLGGVAAAHDELRRHQGGGIVQALLEGHVVVRGDRLGIGDEDEGELISVRRGRGLEGVLLAHELAAVAHPVDVHGIGLQVLQHRLMSGQLLPARGHGVHIAGAPDGLPAALPLFLVLDDRGGDLRHCDPAEPQVPLGGVRGHGDLAGLTQDAAVIHKNLDGCRLVVGLGEGLAVRLDLQVIEQVARLVRGQIRRAGGAGDGHGQFLGQVVRRIAIVQHRARHAGGARHTGRHSDLGVLVHVVHGPGDDPGAVRGEVHRRKDGGVIALQDVLKSHPRST